VKIKQVIQPDPDAHAKYEDYYQIYRELYTRNRSLMQRLSRLAHGN
jgi:sugar (pentulose or hexulose) kinase